MYSSCAGVWPRVSHIQCSGTQQRAGDKLSPNTAARTGTTALRISLDILRCTMRRCIEGIGTDPYEQFRRIPNSRVDTRVRAAISGSGAVQAASALAAVSARQTAIIYGAVVAAIIIALSPALFFSFGYHNDYNQWSYDSHTCCLQYPETNMLIDIGRYFGAFAQNLQSFTIHTLDDLWRWRLIGILSTAGLAAYYLHIVSLRRPPTWQNACLSVAVFTLPTMQFQAIWVAMYAFWTPPILLSLAAAHLLVRATDRGVLVKVKDRYILADRPVLWQSADSRCWPFRQFLPHVSSIRCRQHLWSCLRRICC